MSKIPFTHPFFDDYDRTSRLFDEALGYQRTGLGLAPFYDTPSLYRGYFVSPSTTTTRRPSAGRSLQRRPSQYEDTADRFRVMLDVQHFSPEEINVKLAENRIVVHAKHEEKEDEHGYISREFTRQYVLPEGTDVDNVKSYMSQDGILTLEAPKLSIEKPKERVIPIQMGDPPKEIGDIEEEEPAVFVGPGDETPKADEPEEAEKASDTVEEN
ncbi:heat shock protein beta-2-like [Ptychodera flava]|uniref:heat shock protein beta-2-like n=1 Tax=Ptychodera flava TaxID=63121 RepID=UPI00396A6111